MRFRVFDQPVIEAARERVLAAAREELRYLAAHPDAPDRAERMDTMVVEPGAAHPAAGRAHRRARRPGAAPRGPHAPLLQDPRARGPALAAARRTAVPHGPVSARRPARPADHGARRDRGAARGRRGRRRDWPPRPPTSQSVIDLYLLWRDAAADPDAMAAALGAAVNRAELPATVRRVAVAVSDGAGADVHHFTFRPGDGGFQEERVDPRAPPDDLGAPASLAARELRPSRACRRSRRSTSSTAPPARTRPTSASSRWPRYAI